MDQLRKLLRKRLGGSKVLAHDIAHYDRQESIGGSPDYTYEYLLDAMDRSLRRTGLQANQKSFEDILQQLIKSVKSGKSITPAEVISALDAGA